MKKFNEFKNLKKTIMEKVIISKKAWVSRELIWSKDKKTVVIICKKKKWKMDSQDFDKFCKIMNRLEKIEASTSKPLKIEGDKKMIKNFVVGSRDATLTIGSLIKAKAAIPAVKEVKEVKEVIAIAPVPEKKNPKTGKVIQKKVKGVKGVKGVKASPAIPAQSATPEIRTVILKCKTQEIAEEIIARMADQGHKLMEEIKHIEPGTFDLFYTAESDKPIRAAFKKCKNKDGYNKAGLDILNKTKRAQAKAKKNAEEKKETKISGTKKKMEFKEADLNWPED